VSASSSKTRGATFCAAARAHPLGAARDPRRYLADLAQPQLQALLRSLGVSLIHAQLQILLTQLGFGDLAGGLTQLELQQILAQLGLGSTLPASIRERSTCCWRACHHLRGRRVPTGGQPPRHSRKAVSPPQGSSMAPATFRAAQPGGSARRECRVRVLRASRKSSLSDRNGRQQQGQSGAAPFSAAPAAAPRAETEFRCSARSSATPLAPLGDRR
jgi:hypothetical protein